MNKRVLFNTFALVILLMAFVSMTYAHGVIGKRFFPATIVVDDPFVSDEMSVVLGHRKLPTEDSESTEGNPGIDTTALSIDFSKRITPDFGFSFGTSYKRVRSSDEDSAHHGFDNLEFGLKHHVLKSIEHEGLVSVGVNVDVGGTGSGRVDAESFSTISPALFYGKGFGDLSDSAKYLRPLAITGILAPELPTRRSEPDRLNWGFTVQYNLQYLQSFVKDVGLEAPFNRMIPLVEFPVSTCLNRDCKGQTTGTVNPGFIWFGKYAQVAVEAAIPLNERSGHDVGVFVQLHLFIDDLYPDSIGKPLMQSFR